MADAFLFLQDYFLSFETHDESTLFAFLRLRLRTPQTAAAPLVDDTLLRISDIDLSDGYDFQRTFPELEGCGLVRELHVYGAFYYTLYNLVFDHDLNTSNVFVMGTL